MAFSFTKMHCNGNDYIVLETFTQEIYDLFTLSLILTDRRCGIGADAMIEVSPCEDADAEIRIYAPDGTQTDVAGCAVRCAVKLLYEQQISDKEVYRLKTAYGIVEAEPVSVRRRTVSAVCQRIPLAVDAKTEALTVEAGDRQYRIYPVDHHGRHCVFLLNENFAAEGDIEQVNLAAVASAINRLADYKQAAIEILDFSAQGDSKMRMWIPGQGEARANANGAAACVKALCASGAELPLQDVRLAVRGGEMVYHIADGVLYLTGKVQAVYDGVSQL